MKYHIVNKTHIGPPSFFDGESVDDLLNSLIDGGVMKKNIRLLIYPDSRKKLRVGDNLTYSALLLSFISDTDEVAYVLVNDIVECYLASTIEQNNNSAS